LEGASNLLERYKTFGTPDEIEEAFDLAKQALGDLKSLDGYLKSQGIQTPRDPVIPKTAKEVIEMISKRKIILD
jgi:hypothetical protein